MYKILILFTYINSITIAVCDLKYNKINVETNNIYKTRFINIPYSIDLKLAKIITTNMGVPKKEPLDQINWSESFSAFGTHPIVTENN